MWFVNDSPKERQPGDVYAFATESDMLLQFEYWFADEPHLVFDELGQAFKFRSDGDHLSINRRADLDLNSDELVAFMTFIEAHQIEPDEMKPANQSPISTFLSRIFSR